MNVVPSHPKTIEQCCEIDCDTLLIYYQRLVVFITESLLSSYSQSLSHISN